MSTSSGPVESGTDPDDPYVDVPLWEEPEELLENEHGICGRCGGLTDDPGERLCDTCWELGEE